MPFGIPTFETGESGDKNKVRTNILTIETLRKNDTQGLLTQRGAIFGKAILDNLPETVRSFTYSGELTTVTAVRKFGTEGWNAQRAFDWSISDMNAGVKASLLEQIGKIS